MIKTRGPRGFGFYLYECVWVFLKGMHVYKLDIVKVHMHRIKYRKTRLNLGTAFP